MIVHDVILAPATAFASAVANVLIGQGGKPDDDTLLGRLYILAWIALTVLLVAAVAWVREHGDLRAAETLCLSVR